MREVMMRGNLIELLSGGSAHVTPEQALADLPPDLRHRRPAGCPHSVWEELEHMRIAQEDILRYSLDPDWKSPPFPEGYWGRGSEEPPAGAWEKSISGFFGDLEEVKALVRDPARDLTAEIAHGEGRTWLRQVLLVADHNAYHLGQIVQIRRLLGCWPEASPFQL